LWKAYRVTDFSKIQPVPQMATAAIPTSRWRRLIDALSLHISERKLLLVAGDTGCWAAAILFEATLTRSHGGLPTSLTAGLGMATLSWLLLLSTTGGYDVETAARMSRILPVMGKAVVGVSLVVVAWSFFSHGSVGRVDWAIGLLTAALLLTIWRLSYLHVFTMPLFSRRLLFAGTDALNVQLAALIQSGWQTQFAITGFLAVEGETDPTPGPLVGHLSDGPVLAKAMRVSEIIASPRAMADAGNLDRLISCTNVGFKVVSASALYEQLFNRVPVEQVDRKYIIDLAQGAYADRSYLGLKRLLDVSLGLLGVCVLVVSFPAIALAILIDSGRPVFYRQERIGYRGRRFRIIKFRTMRRDAERDERPRWAERRDCRVTRVGRILRATRLDELPQVVAILSGSMSVVGPRPERPQFVVELVKQIPFYDTRHSVKPGLTGWAQVSMGYGASVEDARDKLEYDLFYVRHQSLLLDLLIIMRTIGTVAHLGGR
jgi:exopolysaccharide biosynthesis polyprenyl glycosylphosphotransferase